MAREGMAQHGTAVFAHAQSRGKGQRERNWVSAEGQNLALSLVLEPTRPDMKAIFGLSITIANAAHQFLSNYIPEELCIKWPNDIYWRDRKAAGILIENIWQGGEWKWAIAGIGININQTDFGELGKKAVSLRQILGRSFEPIGLARELCTAVEQQWANRHFAPETYYLSHLYKRDQKVRLKKANRLFEATVRSVDELGRLVVQHAVEEHFEVGEIEWVV